MLSNYVDQLKSHFEGDITLKYHISIFQYTKFGADLAKVIDENANFILSHEDNNRMGTIVPVIQNI